MDNLMEDTEEQNDFDNLREAIQTFFAPPDLVARIRSQDEEIARLRRFVTDQSKTCYSCESCGHARTTRECLWCEVNELRALCGEAADAIRTLKDTSHFIATKHENLRSRLRAASKGEK